MTTAKCAVCGRVWEAHTLDAAETILGFPRVRRPGGDRMSGFIDYCTVGECGEPATTSLASRPGEAFCPAHHTRDTESGAWVSCPGCAFQCREGEWRRLVDHVWGHARHAKDDADLVERQRRAQVCRFVELVDGLQAVVTQAREAL